MSELTTIARPYAKAAFDFAVETSAIDHWLAMLAFTAEVSRNQTMHDYLSGGASVEQATELFLQVCGEQIDSQGQNFIKVMAENKRLVVLPQVFEQFSALKAEFEKQITVSVTSATALSAEQESSLSAALEKRLARKVKLDCVIDESVVSGVIIKADDMVIDGSVRGKLDRLASVMQS